MRKAGGTKGQEYLEKVRRQKVKGEEQVGGQLILGMPSVPGKLGQLET